MKHLIFVKNLNNEEDVLKIREAFEESRIEYEILLSDRCIVIYGRNDIVRAAKTLLMEAGYIIS